MHNPWFDRLHIVLLYVFICCTMVHNCARLSGQDDKNEEAVKVQKLQSIRLGALSEELEETRTKVEIVRKECQSIGASQSFLEDGDRIIMNDCFVDSNVSTSCRFHKQ